ncbi:asparagine synthase (glutamine-hydrolyzing) [Prescottella agglutinans]|uniref:asparagine synthase (glutamine-hydrolyzing) n=1 Tax=Prescottella agglutinans TaxID=1644129 RepID=A0A438BEC2_9NOCA|nr:asparagine synthase (glutamine-hydrolyzing) [Prescottella agglutinans]RVW09035.1 asparagine synthase (glutamine-hydrolyzing) [Prescottella agglutinans]
MCGIAGWVSFDSDLTRQQSVIDAMTDTMALRGPDGSGTFVRTHVGLGHRRLAIIDPPGGAQPMSVSTSAGDVGMVYTGEAYNYLELRDQLRALGHSFRTDSDSEVVLHAYLQWGECVVDHLNGMYAFAIWDQRDEKLVMIRDRMGIKPFYYYPTPDGVLFGSEPKAILANPLARKAVDLDGVRELFAMTKAPGRSVWKGMHEVAPGTLIRVDRNGIHERTYWRLEAAEHTDGREESVQRVRDLLTDTVDRQLISDVPSGVLLSGGLDSSAITGLAAASLARNGEQLRTFSVDFLHQEQNFVPDEVRGTPDAPYARDVAALVGSAHQNVMLNSVDMLDLSVRRAVITARDMPGLGDMDLSLYLLFKAIREQSTVALSGESADEVFGGYPWFHAERAVNADTFPWAAFTGDTPWDALNPELREPLDIDSYVADQYAAACAEVEHLPGESAAEFRMREVCYLHLTRFVRILLDRKDRLSMAAGLEVRVPFCDHRLVEYVYNTPWPLKTFDGREKSLLRHATKHVLPQSVVDRVKSGYPLTQDPAYATNLQQLAKEILSETNSPVFDLIDRNWLQQLTAQDPMRMDPVTRAGLDRAVDIYTWLDLYRPGLQLD